MSGEGQRTCSHCGASMQEAQDWCLQCGSGASRHAGSGPSWRSAALAIGATGALALGASAAAYAALQQPTPAKRATVAQKPAATAPPTSTTPTPPATGQGANAPNSQGSSPSTSTPAQSLKTSSSPPKIPSSTPTPTGAGKGSAQPPTSGGQGAANSNNGKSKGKSNQGTGSSSSGSTPSNEAGGESGGQPGTHGSQPVAILLDTNAAQVYNPGKLAANRFSDPSLAIDGDATTAWTAQLEPAAAPAVGAGLTLNLNAPLSVAQLTLITETVGITIQIYGTTRANPPESLSFEGWVRLSKQHLVKKRKATIDLSKSKERFRQLLIWILKAPTSSTGQFTGSAVAINEIQLYEPNGGGN